MSDCSFCRALPRRGFLQGGAALAALSAAPASAAGDGLFMQSIADDVRMGVAQYPELIKAFGGAYPHPRIQDYVTGIGKRLAAQTEMPDLPYEFTVLNSPIVNAVALPGGKTAVTRGLLALAATEAELAGVMAHEIGHVTARHGARSQSRSTLTNLGLSLLGLATKSNELMQLSQTVAAGFLQSYSREQEFESDSLGVRYMTKAGYDPAAMASFLGSLREHSQLEARMQGLPPGEVDKFNIMASHPRTVERVEQARTQAQTAVQAGAVQNPVVAREQYLDAINGLMFADDPAQGLIRGRRFIHTSLGIQFEVPEGFVLRNSPQQVSAQNQRGSGIVFDMAPVQRARTPLEYLQYEWLAKIRLSQVEPITVNGIGGATGYARVNSGNGQTDLRGVVLEAGSGQVYRFLFMTPPRETQSVTPGLRATTYSFRRISPEEAKQAQPLRIISAEAREGDTVERLAGGLPYGAFNADWFRLLNDIPAGQEPAPGQIIKIVVGY